MSYSVYIHTNLINQKQYVGITCQPCVNRWGIDGKGYKKQSKFFNDIQKYGWNNFKHEILYTNLSKEKALEKETQLIKELDTIKNGYNTSYSENVASKRILCKTTNTIFESVSDAAQYANIDPSTLSHCLSGDWDTCGNFNGNKLEWEYVDFPELNEKAKIKKQERKEKREAEYNNEIAQKIIEEYKNGESIRTLYKKYGYSRERIKYLLEFHNIQVLSSEQRCRKGVCKVDDNENILDTYNSIADALRSLGINPNDPGRIKKACEEKWRKVKGFHWRWAQEVLNNE